MCIYFNSKHLCFVMCFELFKRISFASSSLFKNGEEEEHLFTYIYIEGAPTCAHFRIVEWGNES